MTVSENIELVKQASDAYNRDGARGMAEFMDESVVDYFATGQEPLIGKKAFVDDNIAFAKIFANLQAEITNIFGQDDWVCIQGIMTATHKGPFTLQNGKQIPPTGKSIRIPICNVIRLRDGKITEIHEYFDQMSFMIQLEAS
ncbi:MAG: ester cyclase [Candidatus Thorarchaeota archaeon]|jgi:ketosteroid isomerase-like protein